MQSKKLSDYFLQLKYVAETLWTCNNFVFLLRYLENKTIRYKEVYLAYEEALSSKGCKKCLSVKLKSLDFDNSALNLYDSATDCDID